MESDFFCLCLAGWKKERGPDWEKRKSWNSHRFLFIREKEGRSQEGSSGNFSLLLPITSPASPISILITPDTLTTCSLSCAFTHPVKHPISSETLPCYSLCVESPSPLSHPLKACREFILVLKWNPTFSRGFGDHLQSEEIFYSSETHQYSVTLFVRS